MSLLTPQIDLVLRWPGDRDRVALVAVDDGAVDDAAARENALRRKLSVYLEFVASGQFRETYPEFAQRPLMIKVVCNTPPSTSMAEIESVRSARVKTLVLPVDVMTELEFKQALSLASSENPTR